MWKGLAAHMGRMQIPMKLNEKFCHRKRGHKWKLVLKFILKKQVGRPKSEFIWLVLLPSR